MSLEVFGKLLWIIRCSLTNNSVSVATRDAKVPDPGTDEVVAVAYAHHISGSNTKQTGALALQSPRFDQRRLRDMKLEILMNELDLLNRLIDLTAEIDPDILTGWEVQAGSWGYLEARGQIYGSGLVSVCQLLRLTSDDTDRSEYFRTYLTCPAETLRWRSRSMGNAQVVYIQSRWTSCSEFMENNAF
jgi:DNA polymerase elongation subunit (family B)